jgi:hypothetical protein
VSDRPIKAWASASAATLDFEAQTWEAESQQEQSPEGIDGQSNPGAASIRS